MQEITRQIRLRSQKNSPSTPISELLNTSQHAQFLQFFLLFLHPAKLASKSEPKFARNYGYLYNSNSN
jgi:hypothetical protein